MVIGIIGASLAGLVAGERLAKAGHDVTVIERNQSLCGTLASVEMDEMILDYGVPHLYAETNTFREFLEAQQQKEEVREWVGEFGLYEGKVLLDEDPNAVPYTFYAFKNGINSIASNLSRWVDLKPKEKAGGLTYIGPERGKKRSWMINLTNINVFECDAVIIATPAPEAYGVLQTAQDETPARRIIRQIDDVHYDDRISLAATYDRPSPDWKGIRCENSPLAWIGNESAKRGVDDSTGLLLQSTDRFFQDHENTGDEEARRRMLEIASDIVGPWVFKAQSTYLHRWKFFRPRNPLNDYFIELEMIDAPLALVGNYFGGTSLDNACLSSYNLAEYWINKYSDVTLA